MLVVEARSVGRKRPFWGRNAFTRVGALRNAFIDEQADFYLLRRRPGKTVKPNWGLTST